MRSEKITSTLLDAFTGRVVHVTFPQILKNKDFLNNSFLKDKISLETIYRKFHGTVIYINILMHRLICVDTLNALNFSNILTYRTLPLNA